MTFPNANAGVKKVYNAQVLSIIGMILSVIAGILGAIGEANDSGAVVGAALVVIIAAAIMIIAEIMNIVGVNRASKDEEAFKKALIALVVGIVANVLMIYSSEKSNLISSLSNFVGTVSSFIASYFVCTGIINLADRLNNAAVSEDGKKSRSLLMYIWLGSAAITLINSFISNSSKVASVISIISSILSIAAIIIYFILLGKAKKMLAE